MLRAIRRAFESIGKLPQPVLAVFAAVLVGLVAIADYHHWEFRVSFFFLVPISLAAWYVGRSAGIALSVLSALAWLVTALKFGHPFSSSLIPYGNAVLLVLVFLVFGLLVSALKRALDRERSSARIDGLTQIANRRAFLEFSRAEIGRAARYDRPFTVASIDVDNLKAVNDQHGHAVGDELLRRSAEILQRNLRRTDILARLGGDEFMVLLPETGEAEAAAAFEKIRAQLAGSVTDPVGPVSCSIGVLTFLRPPASVDEMMKMADELMYCAKREGKNRMKRRVAGASPRMSAR